ncbi:hypothetical protein CEXT_462411 [Caerostris extrusa]|uniref:Uncharacterized protein n=1 Tax=Caerostris extrusa TaxID=172846 RepID=A0AAV4WLF7_CAEEX|nr:hypothetical protein CEXT_462411 [Caerostris extrusa]
MGNVLNGLLLSRNIRPFKPSSNASPVAALLTAPLTVWMGVKRIGFSFTSIAIKSDFIHSDSYPSQEGLNYSPCRSTAHEWLMTSLVVP